MSEIVLNGEKRTDLGKGDSYRLRQNGKIPAVFYGKGHENIHISVNPRELEKAVSTKRGMNALMQLKIDGKEFHVLLRDYQAHPIKRNFTHADFVFVDLTKKIHVSVPVHLTGRPEGVKEGGILEQITRELDVLCLPNKIPDEILVDVTPLKVGQNLHLHDIKLPEGVEPRGKQDVTLAAVMAPKEEEVVAPVAGAPLAEPEVLTAKKDDAAAGAEAGKDAKAGAKPAAAKPAAKGDKK